MQVLWVAPYPEAGASSRYRIVQLLEPLRSWGIHSTFHPLMPASLFARFYEAGRWVANGVGLAGAQLRQLARAVELGRYDVVVVQREASLVGPPVFEWLAHAAAHRPLVFDVDDPVFLNGGTTQSRYPRLHRLLYDPGKAARIARMSAHIVVASRFAEAWAREHTDRVTLSPTVVDGSRFRPWTGPRPGPPVVGWVGSHSTAPMLLPLAPLLAQLQASDGIRVRLVGAGRGFALPGVDVENVPWRQDTEALEFARLDVGLAPLSERTWNQGKPGFKNHIYTACGVPQVGSPVGDVVDWFDEGTIGWLPAAWEGWAAPLTRLVRDPALRSRMGAAARRHFEAGRNLDTEVALMARVLYEAAGRAAPASPVSLTEAHA
jgi:glycosyltransferase involved in cell wall biosynthesis